MDRHQFSTDPVADASRYYEGAAADQDDAARHEDCYRQMFIADAMNRGLQQTNTLGDTVIDFTQPMQALNPRPRRLRTVAEVMRDSLDYPNGPSADDLLFYLVTMAKSGEPGALALVRLMSIAYARHKA